MVILLLCVIDWVFDIPNKYEGCPASDVVPTVEEMDKCDLAAQSDKSIVLSYYFNATVHAPSVIHVSCVNKKKADGLPDYVWHVKGDDGRSHEYRGFVPSCVDPTYCETDPPTTFDTDPPTQLDPNDPQVSSWVNIHELLFPTHSMQCKLGIQLN